MKKIALIIAFLFSVLAIHAQNKFIDILPEMTVIDGELWVLTIDGPSGAAIWKKYKASVMKEYITPYPLPTSAGTDGQGIVFDTGTDAFIYADLTYEQDFLDSLAAIRADLPAAASTNTVHVIATLADTTTIVSPVEADIAWVSSDTIAFRDDTQWRVFLGGSSTVNTDNTLTGDGSVGSPLGVDSTVMASLSALQDTAAAIRGDVVGGLSSVASDNTLTGNGTSGSPLKVDTTVIASQSALQDSSAAIRAAIPSTAGLMSNFTVIGNTGTAETIQDGEELELRGRNGITTSNSPTDIMNIDADTSFLATVNALRDSSATIRADFPTGGGTAFTVYDGVTSEDVVDNDSLNFIWDEGIIGAVGPKSGGQIDINVKFDGGEATDQTTPSNNNSFLMDDASQNRLEGITWPNLVGAMRDSLGTGGGGAGLDTLPNYTALRAYTGGSNAVHVTNQGIFVRAASGSEDGGTVIVASNSVVWKRVFDGCTYYPEYWENGGYDETGTVSGITDTTEMIQAAINLANSNGGGEVILRPGKYYSVIPKAVNTTFGGDHRYCIDVKSNVKLTIMRGAVLRKADGAQTDAGGPVDVLHAKCVENIEISGGGEINGNTAGQTGWTGGYSQAGVNGAGIYISRQTFNTICNYNVVVKDLRIVDHFSNSVDITHTKNAIVENVYSNEVGEGIEFIFCDDVSVLNVEITDTSAVAVGDGLELSTCTNFSIADVYIHTNGQGSAIDVYSSKNGSITNFVLDGYGGGGISMGTNVADIFCDKVTITNGVIRNYLGAGEGGIYPCDGELLVNNVLFDSVQIGFNITSGTYLPAAQSSTIKITGCTFNDFSGATGVLVQGKRRLSIIGNSFRKINIGIQDSWVAGGQSTMEIIGNIFDSIGLYNIHFDPQAQSYPTYDPKAIIKGDTFINQLGTIGINGLSRTHVRNVRTENNFSDVWPVWGTNVDLNGLEEVSIGVASTITTILEGARDQIVRLNCKGLAAFNSRVVNDPRNSGGGNIYLKDGEPANLSTGDMITLKYDIDNNIWHEISRGQTGNFFGSGKPIGLDILVLDGWMYENVAPSLTNQRVDRFGATAYTYGDAAYLSRDFAIRKFSIRSSVPITAGTITAELFWGGGGPNKTVVLSTSNPSSNVLTQGRYSSVINAGSIIQVKISSSADLAPSTADVYIWLEGEY